MGSTREAQGLQEIGAGAMGALRELVGALNEAITGEDDSAIEDATEAIHDDVLSIEYRSGWTMQGEGLQAEEYCLLLATGGPAVRIIGTIEHEQARDATLQVQDWGTPWTDVALSDDDHDTLLQYARAFCLFHDDGLPMV